MPEPPKKKESGLLAIFWVVWIAIAFFGAFGGVDFAWRRYVIAPHCASACASRGQTFTVFRPGGRSGPPSACLCADGSAIETDVDDGGMMLGPIVFLVACYAPLAIAARRGGKRDRSA
ncbi:MAG: hypothetical protein U0234_24205 [Sandaracinus sp.]